jgi:hypothetical protein
VRFSAHECVIDLKLQASKELLVYLTRLEEDDSYLCAYSISLEIGR